VTFGTATDGKPVTLRRMTADDMLILYEWQCHPESRRFARNPQPPELEDHKKWFTARLASDDCLLWLILHDGAAAGVLRFDRKAGVDAWEISIVVAPSKKGRGIATAALALGRETMPSAELVAEVLPGNDPSHRLFGAAGYVLEDDGLYHSYPADDMR
jgi:UDP-2,4-diacetamido-2,4,6-trideoxy-beta-L-altropyranose hydrolase